MTSLLTFLGQKSMEGVTFQIRRTKKKEFFKIYENSGLKLCSGIQSISKRTPSFFFDENKGYGS